jgi:hypothetical protein
MLAADPDLLRCHRAQNDGDCANLLYVKRGEIGTLILDAVRYNAMRPRYVAGSRAPISRKRAACGLIAARP